MQRAINNVEITRKISISLKKLYKSKSDIL